MKAIGAGVIAAYVVGGCALGSSYLEEGKAAAEQRWRDVGYEVVGYEGYQFGFLFAPGYGGAKVWHSLRRAQNPTVIYTGYIQRWGTDWHIYGPRAIDAIGGAKK